MFSPKNKNFETIQQTPSQATTATAQAQPQQTPSSARPYKTRERLYYETDYIKGGSAGGLTSATTTGSAVLFEPFLKQAHGKEEFGTAPEDLPPTTSLYEFMFSPSKAGDSAPENNSATTTSKVQLPALSMPETAQPITKAVTVFGFPPSCRSEIVSAFASFGPIEQYDFGESNWLHIIYDSEWSAQKALARNGSIFNPGGMMIGVMPMQAALEQVSAAADSFMSPIKGELDRTRPVTQSIFKAKAAKAEENNRERLINLPDDSSFMTKAVNYLFKW